ncbi:MobV family relaxase [Tunicatimonas pelagia]|uniref:MobV family relaxase n=1 Tax=Tunicatimonas pelagia TaxID=931531 RepID=UPI002666C63A|nr:MobV family relaxase [Tunicatimonas pelagia]WKN46525.1 MobV family relaxase [Tunicatimonas pelagia]
MANQFAVFHAMKGRGTGGALGRHIDRSSTPKNADQDRTHLNKFIVREKDGNTKVIGQSEFQERRQKGEIKDMFASVNERIKEGHHGKSKIRSNAVRYVNIMMSGSHERMKEIEREGSLNDWMNKNHEFLSKEFGKDNIVRFAMHADEKTPHIHATVVPLTEDGRLSARDYLFGHKSKLKGFQDRYAEAMKEYGLERGVQETRSKHKTTKQYYKEIGNPARPKINVPERSENESRESYHRRVERSLEPVVLRSIAIERELNNSKDRTERVERRNTILQTKNDSLVKLDKDKEESLGKYLKMVREQFPEAVKDKDKIDEYGRLIGKGGFVKYNPMFKEISAALEKEAREKGWDKNETKLSDAFGKESKKDRFKRYLRMIEAKHPGTIAPGDKIDENGRLIGKDGFVKHNPMFKEITEMEKGLRKKGFKEIYYGYDRGRDDIIGYD